MPSGAYNEVLYSPNTTTNRQYQTTIVYYCPSNLTLPSIIKSNFSFAYTESFGFVANVTAICRVNGWVLFRFWVVHKWHYPILHTFRHFIVMLLILRYTYVLSPKNLWPLKDINPSCFYLQSTDHSTRHNKKWLTYLNHIHASCRLFISQTHWLILYHFMKTKKL